MADISEVTLIVKKEDGTEVSNTTYDIKDKIAREQLNAIPDGTYPDMSVGNVFSDDSYTEDQIPYLYRISGGGVEVGKVEADKIVGGTVAWNQIYQTHTTYNVFSGDVSALSINVSNGYLNVVGTATADAQINIGPNTVDVPANHVCLILCDGWDGFAWRISGFAPKKASYYMNKHSENFQGSARINIVSGTTYNIHARFSTYSLTQMFGSAVADMIYNMEQSTAGAGVAFFRSLFPDDYYEYNAGELKSVEGLQSHDMVGFNQWDEEWELGIYNISNGEKVRNTNAIMCKNPIPVLPNTSYFKHVGGEGACTYGCYYDEDGNFISRHNAQKNTIFVTPKNCYYMTFYCESSYGVTYNHDICINFSSDRNGEYEPYVKHSYPLDSSLTLRGIPKVADGKLYYDGDEYSADGNVVRKYGIVDMGTLRWIMYSVSEGTLFRAAVNGSAFRYGSRNFICKYPNIYAANRTEGTSSVSANGAIDIIDSSYTDAESFKSAMSGVMLVYELATPTEETAQAYTEYQKVSKYGTEEYVSTSIVPVGHITKYPTDIVSKVDGLPSDFSTLIAPTESAMKATKAYTANDLIIVNNQLYRATASIASGATLTVGTNVVATTIAALIKGLL